MYDKIEQGKHIKKVNRIQNEPKDAAATTATAKKPERKKK